MSDLAIFVAIVGAVAVIGVALGMIVAGRIDRRMTPTAAEAPPASQEDPS